MSGSGEDMILRSRSGSVRVGDLRSVAVLPLSEACRREWDARNPLELPPLTDWRDAVWRTVERSESVERRERG